MYVSAPCEGLFSRFQASALYDKANQIASDAFGACRTVAAFNLREEIFQLYSSLLDAPEKELNKRYPQKTLQHRFLPFKAFRALPASRSEQHRNFRSRHSI